MKKQLIRGSLAAIVVVLLVAVSIPQLTGFAQQGKDNRLDAQVQTAAKSTTQGNAIQVAISQAKNTSVKDKLIKNTQTASTQPVPAQALPAQASAAPPVQQTNSATTDSSIIIPEGATTDSSIIITDSATTDSSIKTNDGAAVNEGASETLTSSDIVNVPEKSSTATSYKDKYKETVLGKGRADEKVVALTFDDGPDGRITPMILDTLKANNVHGSFFFLGQYVKKYPAVVKRAYTEGNLVLNHSYSHPEWTKASEQSVLNEISSTDDSIRQVIGKTPILVRSPYGITNKNVVDAARSKGDKLVIWSVDSLDWKYRNASHIVQNVMSTVHSGDIILMHSNSDKIETAKALQEIINQLSKQGYKIVTLDYLLSVNAYK